ncbi:MAG: hypothetical protein KBC84_01695 [Proteobacteria bacterium]|nr:hypothetical protein [Pseudomonadota bacterium]
MVLSGKFFLEILNKLRRKIRRSLVAFSDFAYRRELLLRAQMGRGKVRPVARRESIVVSLTSYQERMPYLHLCLESLLSQDMQPSRVVLWLAEGTVIDSSNRRLISGQIKRGLEIRYCEDLRSYKKFFFAFQEFSNSLVVTADDDFMYPKNWLSSLIDSYQKCPEYLHCHRAHYIEKNSANEIMPYSSWDWLSPGIIGPSHRLFVTTGAGAVFNPRLFSKEVFNREIFEKLCPTADDVWINAMLLMNGIKCQKVQKNTIHLPQIAEMHDEKRLSLVNVENGSNDLQIKKILNYYDLYRKIN